MAWISAGMPSSLKGESCDFFHKFYFKPFVFNADYGVPDSHANRQALVFGGDVLGHGLQTCRLYADRVVDRTRTSCRVEVRSRSHQTLRREGMMMRGSNQQFVAEKTVTVRAR